MDQLQATSREFYQGREIAVMDRDYCCNAVVTANEHTGYHVVINEEGEMCVNVEIVEGSRRGEIGVFDVLLLETLAEDEDRFYQGVEGAQLPSEKKEMSKVVAKRIAGEHGAAHFAADQRAAVSLCGFDKEEAEERIEKNDWTEQEHRHIATVGRALLAEEIGTEKAERYFEALRVLSGKESEKGEDMAG